MSKLGRPGCAALMAGALLGTACSGRDELRCADGERYQAATTAPPLRVPDDLTVPDESDALDVPTVGLDTEAPAEGRCLEDPPPFFESGAPGGQG